MQWLGGLNRLIMKYKSNQTKWAITWDFSTIHAYAKASLNAMLTYPAQLKVLMFGLSPALLPYFVYSRSKGSGETARLNWTFAADTIITQIWWVDPNQGLQDSQCSKNYLIPPNKHTQSLKVPAYIHLFLTLYNLISSTSCTVHLENNFWLHYFNCILTVMLLCFVSLSRGAMGWSVVFDCGISKPYLLFVVGEQHRCRSDCAFTKSICYSFIAKLVTWKISIF